MQPFVCALVVASLFGIVATASSQPSLAAAETTVLRPGLRVVTEVLGLVNGQPTFAGAINNVGQIAGSTGDKAFVWTRQRGYRIIARGDAPERLAGATDINDHGIVTGYRSECLPEAECSVRGFAWSAADGLQDLGSFLPFAINESGEMAGICADEDRACVMRAGVVLAVPNTANFDGSYASGINEQGDVIGSAAFEGDGNFPRGFVLNRNSGFRWQSPDDDPTLGNDINDGGIGVGDSAGGGVFWTAGGARRRLRTDSATEGTSPTAINSDGVVIGTGFLVEGGTGPLAYAVAWESPQSVGLPLPTPGQFAIAEDINDRRQMVGSVFLGAGVVHPVLWTLRYTLTVTTANAASRWGVGTRQRIAWTYTGDAPQFEIEISRNSGRTWDYLATVANAPGDSQDFIWTVTAPLTSAAKFRVTAIGDPGASDVNNADIKIVHERIEVLSPAAGAAVVFGSGATIFFKHTLGARAPIAIEVSVNNGATWRTIGETRTTGSRTASFSWLVDVPRSSRARVRIRALDGSRVSGMSGAFSVTVP
jgi:uncharacterized membrane protein